MSAKPGIISNMCSSKALAKGLTGSWPSPAQDYFDGTIDLAAHLIERPLSTFLVRVGSESLRALGIRAGDELVVDRSLPAKPGRVLVVVADGERRVGVMRIQGGRATLVAGNERIPLTAEVELWGVATLAIRHLPGGPPRVLPQ